MVSLFIVFSSLNDLLVAGKRDRNLRNIFFPITCVFQNYGCSVHLLVIDGCLAGGWHHRLDTTPASRGNYH